jgi:hypothetical protein
VELARDRTVFQPQDRREPGQAAKQEGSFRLQGGLAGRSDQQDVLAALQREGQFHQAEQGRSAYKVR